MNLSDFHHRDHEPFQGTPVIVTMGQRSTEGTITRATRTMVYVRYTPHPSARPAEERFWKKDGSCVRNTQAGYGPVVALKPGEE